MKTTFRVMAVLFWFFVAGHAQQTWDTHIASLQMPCYPPLARLANAQGTARIKLVIADDGSVPSAEAVEGHALLAKAAIDNVRTWKFATDDGRRPLEAPVVVFEYKLEDRSDWNSCATRVVFESWSKVTVVSNFTRPTD